ncbi:MAG: redoxin domain-containing protein [Planctomycetota bacterium]|nr:redoxin domain-containing protein [Planctomycetota bacterium]
MNRSAMNLARVALMLLCACLTLMPVSARADQEPTIGTAVGEAYPDFVFPTLEGQDVRLSDYRGRKVLLIHFASW